MFVAVVQSLSRVRLSHVRRARGWGPGKAKWKNTSKSSEFLGHKLDVWMAWRGDSFESPLVKYLLSCEGKCCRVKQRTNN